MIVDPSCPVCEGNDWEVMGSRTYHREAMKSSDDYLQKRLRVLFEIWYPGEEQVVNRSLLCQRCGFVIYSPRPAADEQDRKYRFLTSLETDQNREQITPAREALRAKRLWKKMGPLMSNKSARVLDFGGGDGRLVVPFAERGANCFVIDYHPQPVDQVTRLGTTLDDLDEEERFDVIVCSHVIEHVAEPYEILVRLRAHLCEGGKIYVEVPSEIWKRPPLHDEPVTHVNFFTVGSLRTLFQRAGISPLRVRRENYPHPLGHHAVVVSGIGTFKADETPVVEHRGTDESRRLFNPPWTTRVQRALLQPQGIPRTIWNRLSRRGGP